MYNVSGNVLGTIDLLCNFTVFSLNTKKKSLRKDSRVCLKDKTRLFSNLQSMITFLCISVALHWTPSLSFVLVLIGVCSFAV